MPITIDEQTILDSLRHAPVGRWAEVLRFIDALNDPDPAIRTGVDLLQSGMVGMWADREDLGNRQEFARQSRRRAEACPKAADTSEH